MFLLEKAAKKKKRVFIAFAMEDESLRNLLVGQAKSDKTPFEFIDMSVKEPYTDSWKTQCRTKIKGCDGMIALVSFDTAKSSGEKWEMTCASDEGVPLIGIYAYNYDGETPPPKPTELGSKPLVKWTWPAITNFIDSL